MLNKSDEQIICESKNESRKGFTAEDSSVMQTHQLHVKWIAKVALLSAIAYVLMMLEFPLPLMPDFLKFDFSEIASLLAAFSMGPLAGVMVCLLKNLLHLPFSNTMMIGELANFLIGASFVGTAGLIYGRHKTKKAAMLSMAAGTIAMTLVGSLFNFWINIPFYVQVMGFPLEAIIGLSQAAGNTLVHDMNSLILWVFVPFNLFKGGLVSILVSLMYKKVSPLLHS